MHDQVTEEENMNPQDHEDIYFPPHLNLLNNICHNLHSHVTRPHSYSLTHPTAPPATSDTLLTRNVFLVTLHLRWLWLHRSTHASTKLRTFLSYGPWRGYHADSSRVLVWALF